MPCWTDCIFALLILSACHITPAQQPDNYSFTVQITIITGNTGSHTLRLSSDVQVVITGIVPISILFIMWSESPFRKHSNQDPVP